MENDNQTSTTITSTIINDSLPFEPRCPHCLHAVDIEKDVAGYYVLCKWCGDEWAASPFTDIEDEMKWLDKFRESEPVSETEPQVKEEKDKHVSIPDEKPQEKDPSPTKVLMEIAHSSEVLKKAYDLVSQAYDLINKDKVARQYIHFHSEVTWHKFVWDILMSQYNKDNPLSDDIYHLRAFDYYGIQPGMYVTDGCVDGQG